MALGAGGNVSKAAEDTLLNPAYLPPAITARAAAGLAAWFRAGTLAQGAALSARYSYLLPATEGCLGKGNSYPGVQVSAAPRYPSSIGCCSTEEGVKNITKAAEAKVFKALSEKAVGTTMPEAVIGSPLISISENLVGFV
jgi:hypothetical protein